MKESYLTISAPATANLREKGSKFFAFAYPVQDETEIRDQIERLRKEYFDATHHCFAWILNPEGSKYRANDDGEPGHSAGDPILGQIRSRGLTNTLVVVVRYYGGTNLGVSGLITATGNINGSNISVSGNVTANWFIGNFSGNINAPGLNTQVVFNDNGVENATAGLTFNKSTNTLSVSTVTTTNITAVKLSNKKPQERFNIFDSIH